MIFAMIGGGGGGLVVESLVVSFSKDIFTPRKEVVIPRKRWLRPDMTEPLLTGALSINTSKTNKSL